VPGIALGPVSGRCRPRTARPGPRLPGPGGSHPTSDRPGPGRRGLVASDARDACPDRRPSRSDLGPGQAALAAGGYPECRVGDPARWRYSPSVLTAEGPGRSCTGAAGASSGPAEPRLKDVRKALTRYRALPDPYGVK